MLQAFSKNSIDMRKAIICISLCSLLGACGPNGLQGNPVAVQAGASIGGLLGAIIGDRVGGYNGSAIGSIVGTVAGAAVGNAVTTPKNTEDEGYYNEYEPMLEPETAPMQESSLRIKNIRFIDDNRNQIIDADENSKIIFEIFNEGDGNVYDIIPDIAEVSGMKHLRISPAATIRVLQPGERVRYTATVSAGKKLKNGSATFVIRACDDTGNCSPEREFSITTQKRR